MFGWIVALIVSIVAGVQWFQKRRLAKKLAVLEKEMERKETLIKEHLVAKKEQEPVPQQKVEESKQPVEEKQPPKQASLLTEVTPPSSERKRVTRTSSTRRRRSKEKGDSAEAKLSRSKSEKGHRRSRSDVGNGLADIKNEIACTTAPVVNNTLVPGSARARNPTSIRRRKSGRSSGQRPIERSASDGEMEAAKVPAAQLGNNSVHLIQYLPAAERELSKGPKLDQRGKILHEGVIELGSRLALKRVWHERYFKLFGDGWMCYYEKKKVPREKDKPSGWLCLSRCAVVTKQRKRIVKINHVRKEKIWYLTGSFASKKRRMMNRGTSSASMRFSSVEQFDGWLKAFAALAERHRSTPEELKRTINVLAASGMLDSSDDDSSVATAWSDEEIDTPSDPDLSSEDATEEPTDLSDEDIAEEPSKKANTPASDDVESSSSSSSSSSSAAASSSSGRSRPARLSRVASVKVIEPDANEEKEEPVEAATEEKKGLMALLKQAVGSDLTTISMPISIHEPASFLMRMAENLQYHELLTKAGSTDDKVEQLMYVTAFAISTYSCNTRTGKPFNPYLGETYQFEEDGVKFYAEQVSHHPPIGASVLESDKFKFWQDQSVKTKFGGNNLDVTPTGQWHVLLKNNKNHITWAGVRTLVYNIIIGGMWVDHFGETEVVSLTGAEKAKVKMTKCGWFSKGRYECKASILDECGKEREQISGKWNTNLVRRSNGAVIWENRRGKAINGNKYSMTAHSLELSHFPDNLRDKLPPTDSRWRRDVAAMLAGDNKLASQEKKALEEKQRAIRRQREESGTPHTPAWFTLQPTHDGTDMWTSTDKYWTDALKQ